MRERISGGSVIDDIEALHILYDVYLKADYECLHADSKGAGEETLKISF